MCYSSSNCTILTTHKSNNQDVIIENCKAKASIAPSVSTVYLQIYNQNLNQWETLDSDSVTGADTEFTLSGTQSINPANYYAGGNWVSKRVYQKAEV